MSDQNPAQGVQDSGSAFGRATKLKQFLLILAGVLAIGGLALKLHNVFTAPIFWDTNYYLNIGSDFIERGNLTVHMWRMDPSWNILTGGGSGYGVLSLVLWLRMFGLSVNSGHIFMYLVGLATLPFIYLFVSDWYGREAGWWGVTFAALCAPFMDSFFVRMDAPVELLYCLILWLYGYARRQSNLLWHALIGFLLIVAVEFHILTFLYVGALGFMYGIDYIVAVVRQRRLLFATPTLYFGVALFASFGVYALVHILPNPDRFFLISRTCGYCVGAGPIKELGRWVTFIAADPVESLVLVVSIIFALIRRQTADIRYLMLAAGSLLAIAVLNPPTSVEYTGHLYPVIALGAASLVIAPANSKAPGAVPFRQIVQVGLMVIMLGLQLRGKAVMPPRLPAMGFGNDGEAVAYIREHVPTDAVVMGPVSMYADLLDYPEFMDYRGGTWFAITIRNESYLDLWKREKPQVIVGKAEDDIEMQEYMRLEGGFDEVQPGLWISRKLKRK